MKRKEEEETAEILAKRYELPYLNLSTVPIEVDAISSIPEDTARRGNIVAFQRVGKHLKIGATDPHKQETEAALKSVKHLGLSYDLVFVSNSSMQYAFEFYRKTAERSGFESGKIEVSPDKIVSLRRKFHNINEVREEVDKAATLRITETIEVLVAGALALDASDAHLEVQDNTARLRLRIDGILEDVTLLPLKTYPLLLSRIKLVSGLKLNIHDQPQDGRFTVNTGEEQIEIRVSSLPGPNGENLVLRVLNPKTIQLTLDQLGMQPWVRETMAGELHKNKGMILTTGPTGSGKTTTLYTFLRARYTPKIKIITIEDPIEYHVPGIEQTQVAKEKGYTFATSLRSVVRQDPDVILVGEIRDFETAETAMHAALTGHLVFSTLHTNNAAGTIPRLIDLGVKPAIIAPAINVMMAQRLLRKLCTDCRKPATPEAEELAQIQKELDQLPPAIPKPAAAEWRLYTSTPDGCPSCHNAGYRGRTGVFEIIRTNPEIERLILKQPAEYEILEEAVRQGETTMRQDGILKLIAGITDFKELNRVMSG